MFLTGACTTARQSLLDDETDAGSKDAPTQFPDANGDRAADGRDAGGDTGVPACPVGKHTCPGGCVSDIDPKTCGVSCTPCDDPLDGVATCDGKSCGGSCLNGKKLCHGACIDSTAACAGSCDPGEHACGDLCPSVMDVKACGTSCLACPVPMGATQASCDGTKCDFACTTGYHKCGAGCALDSDATACGLACVSCPTDPNGTAQCVGGNCGLACKNGYHICGAKCVSNNDVGSCGTSSCSACQKPTGGDATCNGTACLPTCPSGMKVCAGTCIDGAASCVGVCDPGSHNCTGLCASDTSIDSCGTSCMSCPKPTGASSTSCNGTTCSFTCGVGTHLCGTGASARCAPDDDATGCGTACVACPTDSNGTAVCSSGVCAVKCNNGFHICGGKCVDNKAMTTCGPNDLTSCTACQAPTGGGAVMCDGLSCVPSCPSPGTKLCAGACIAVSTPCNGMCPSGTHLCNNTCQPDTSTSACGATCVSCPTPAANGSAVCNSGTCAIACSSTAFKNCPSTNLCIPTAGCCTSADCTSGPPNTTGVCGTANTCSYPCAKGFTPCGSACIPIGNCCSAADCMGVGTVCAGVCGSNGACTYPTTTGCSAPICSGNNRVGAGTCSSGACVAPGAASCGGNFICAGAGLCNTTCAPGFELCLGVCIATGNGNCCSVGECPSTSSSCAATSCNATTHQCVYPSGSCGNATCAGNNSIAAGTCSNGTCPPGPTTPCATGFTCSGAGLCSTCATGFTPCAGGCIPAGNCCDDTNCKGANGVDCNGKCTAGKCVAATGTCGSLMCDPANSNNKLGTGTCSAGVCGGKVSTSCGANFACTGAGVCTCPTTAGFKVCGTACIPSANCCPSNPADCHVGGAANTFTSCDGTCTNGACVFNTNSCGGSSCSSPSIVDAGTCGAGTCKFPAPRTCANNFICPVSGTTCKTSCASNADCAAGFACSNPGASGTCIQSCVTTGCSTTLACHTASCNTTTGLCTTSNSTDFTTCGNNLGLCITGSCNIQTFTLLGDDTAALAVNGDGSVVIGFNNPTNSPFTWTRMLGARTLSNLAGTSICSPAAVSIDGNVAVGSCDNLAVKWTGTMPTQLGFAGGSSVAAAAAANLTGTIITGSNNGRTGIWNGVTPTLLAEVATSTTSSGAGISSDGTVIVGTAHPSSDTTGLGKAYRAKNGVVTLAPAIAAQPAFSNAMGVSADGNNVILFAKGFDTVVWNATTNVQTSLGQDFAPSAISGDGNTVVGNVVGPVVFTVSTKTTVPLSTIFTRLGVTLGDFAPQNIAGVSANGKVLVGRGISSSTGVQQGWILIQP